jgi:hypothetical protein
MSAHRHRTLSSFWSLGMVALTACVVIVYSVTVGAPRVVAGIFAAIVLPLALGSVLVWQLNHSRIEVCIAAAFAGWSVFGSGVGLALWQLSLPLSGTGVGIPDITALVALLILTNHLSGRRLPDLQPRYEIAYRRFLYCLVPAVVLLAAAGIVSVKSESTFYTKGQKLSISVLLGRDGLSTITVMNPMRTAQAVTILVAVGATEHAQSFVRNVPANGRVVMSQQALTATLYQHGGEIASVNLGPGSGRS